MPDNPYEYNPEQDADIFEVDGEQITPEHKHTLDGTVCPTCDEIHDVPPEGVPDEILHEIHQVLDNLPDNVVAKVLSENRSVQTPAADIATTFLDFRQMLEHSNHLGPLLRAIVEEIDEASGGRLSRRWHAYEAERRVVTCHMALKSVNTVLDDATTPTGEEDDPGPAPGSSLLETLCELTVDHLSVLVEEYRQASAAAGYEPLESVIQTGTFPEDVDPRTEKLMLKEILRDIGGVSEH